MRAGAIRMALITGGAGFIGSNLAERLLSDPDVRVRIFDNLSRHGVQLNLDWLRSLLDSRRLDIVHGDLCDKSAVRAAMHGATEVYHLGAQVAVTTSVNDPFQDFEVNALGTLHVLEAARASASNPFLLFTSTNKVYGSLDHLPIAVEGQRYRVEQPNFKGSDEDAPLDFHSPYGCSKGAADQYVRDYARIYDLPTVVFRMSCIAGPRQFGNEDQGWVAHFLYSVLSDHPITIYGNGYQVRDVLHVHDLVEAMVIARHAVDRTRGEIYNLGGGPLRAVSVIQMLQEIAQITGRQLQLQYSHIRPGDQPLYISNTTKFESHTGWQAHLTLRQILDDIHAFWHQNKAAITANAISSVRTGAVYEEQVLA